MAKKKQKFYVVWKGHKPGVYTNWNECHEQLKGFSSPVFKAFMRADVAQKALHEDPEKYLHQDYEEPLLMNFSKKTADRPQVDALTVDAACSGNPGKMEYRGVDLLSGKEVFRMGPFAMGTNNIGEFLALVHGLAWMQQNQDYRPIYTDSETALSWIRKKQARTLLENNAETEKLYELIHRAESWLKNHNWGNEIRKWDTQNWGEIPADFGRK
jgi:ribonuclease HI